MTDTNILTTIAEALYRQAGYVPFLWHIDDVRQVNEDAKCGLDLTDAECLAVLTHARDNVASDTGMSLGIIEIELEHLAELRQVRPDPSGAIYDALDKISVGLARLAAQAAAFAELEGGRP